ncbi:MAG: transporter substrate-binding domain-containing protein [Desulfobacteraceae bacterium]|nr:transporter substrate-binding domain-containing protein [Desulfobacteraceae bacterium]
MKGRFKSVLINFIVCILFVFPQDLFSEELKVGVGYWPPFICSKTAPFSGIDVQLIKEIGKRLNLRVKFIHYPFQRSLFYMKKGRIDMMSSLAKRPERERYMYYLSQPYYSVEPVFYVQKGRNKRIQKYNDLYKGRIGLSAGSAFFEPFDSDDKIRKDPVNTELQLITMLIAGRFEAFIGVNSQIDYLAHREGLNHNIEKAAYRPGEKTDIFLAISLKSKYAVRFQQFNKALKGIIDEGLLKEIIRHNCGQ